MKTVLLVFLLAGYILKAEDIIPGGELPVVITQEWIDVSEKGKIAVWRVQGGTNVFSFIPISNWLLSTNANKPRITLSAPDMSAAITAEITGMGLAELDRVDGTILRRLPCTAETLVGEAVDYEKDLNAKTKLAGRRAIFKTHSTVLLVQMTCKPEVFAKMHRVFNAFAGTLRLEEVPSSSHP